MIPRYGVRYRPMSPKASMTQDVVASFGPARLPGASLLPRVCLLTTPAPTGDGAGDGRAGLHPAGYARPSDDPRPGCGTNPPNTVSTRVSM
jgi:hypothetical protein